MKLIIGTKSTMKNSLIILLSIGSIMFSNGHLYQLTTCYFANLMMNLSWGIKSTIKNSLGILLTTGHLIFKWSFYLLSTCYYANIIDEFKCEHQ